MGGNQPQVNPDERETASERDPEKEPLMNADGR
jgi:hypothetical protein